MIIYEDALVQAEFPDVGVTKGHIIIAPKNSVNSLEDVDDAVVEALFFSASYAATVLFETLGAQGTNIILNENPLSLQVIARSGEEGWSHQWTPKQADASELDSVVEKIDKHIPLAGQDAPKSSMQQETISQEEPSIELTQEEARENYLIRQLYRVP